MGNKAVLLWENSDKSTTDKNYEGRTVTISDDINNYEFIIIEYISRFFNQRTFSNIISVESFKFQGTIIKVFSSYEYLRGIGYSNETTIAFGDCGYFPQYGVNKSTVDNKFAIPKKIYGFQKI